MFLINAINAVCLGIVSEMITNLFMNLQTTDALGTEHISRHFQLIMIMIISRGYI